MRLHISVESDVYLFTTCITAELRAFFADDYNFETTLRYFSAHQRLKIRDLVSDEVKVKKIVTGLFTRLVINCMKNVVQGYQDADFEPFKEVSFEYNDYGKPEVPGLEFNSSTSNDVISVVVNTSGCPIGIDLSHSRQKIADTFMEDFRGIFSDLEYNQLRSYSEERRYVLFNQLWTLKEGFTKYLGYGLNVDLSSFSFDIRGSEVDTQVSRDSGCCLKDVIERDGILSPYTIDWGTDIPVDVHKLKDALRDETLLDQELVCRSGVLLPAAKGELPVVISIVAPLSSQFSTANYNVNLLKLLQELT